MSNTSGEGDPRIPAAFRGGPEPGSAVPDPLHWCVYTTVSLLTWALGPAVLAVFSATALVAYGRAFARGRRTSRCLLRDTRLVLLYVAAVLTLGAVATARSW